MASNLQIDQDINATAQSVKDQNGNASPLVLSSNQVGVGGTDPTALFTLREDGRDEKAILVLRRAETGQPSPGEGASQVVSFKLDPTKAVFNLDVGGSRNSAARIHLGDPSSPDNPVTMLGNVGIGTKDPKEKLHVDGNIIVFGNITVSGDVKFLGADCAEEFDIVDAQTGVTPGTVMVINDDGQLCHSSRAYDTTVAGVVSGAGDYKPGIVLGKSMTNRERVPIALVGKVFCKVDADYAPIRVGDLLTTSSTPGHAMKVTDPLSAIGAVIGKALGAVTTGQTLIPILIALQ